MAMLVITISQPSPKGRVQRSPRDEGLGRPAGSFPGECHRRSRRSRPGRNTKVLICGFFISTYIYTYIHIDIYIYHTYMDMYHIYIWICICNYMDIDYIIYMYIYVYIYIIYMIKLYIYMEWDFPGIAGLDNHWRYGWYVPQSSPWSNDLDDLGYPPF